MLLMVAYPVLAQDATTGATRKEKVATREAALKAKLERFKDKTKAQVVDRINTNLNRINQKQTAQMLKHLDKMSTILGKLEADVTTTKEAIATATAAVKLQAEKDYTIAISSEKTVKKDAQKTREQLHNDLKVVRVQVIDAKQAVANAIRLERKEGTPTGR